MHICRFIHTHTGKLRNFTKRPNNFSAKKPTYELSCQRWKIVRGAPQGLQSADAAQTLARSEAASKLPSDSGPKQAASCLWFQTGIETKRPTLPLHCQDALYLHSACSHFLYCHSSSSFFRTPLHPRPFLGSTAGHINLWGRGAGKDHASSIHLHPLRKGLKKRRDDAELLELLPSSADRNFLKPQVGNSRRSSRGLSLRSQGKSASGSCFSVARKRSVW